MSVPEMSIIVPVYNVDKYLDKCIQSILAQTFRNFELLLVDDGSKDSSGEICDKYAEKDFRVRVFHKENGGVSSARNMGLDNAKAEWVAFVDADDWLYPDYLEKYNHSLGVGSDLYIQGFKESEGNIEYTEEKYYEGEGIVCKLQYWGGSRIEGFVWNKLFRTSIIKSNKLKFNRKISLAEDMLFVYQYLLYAKSVMILPVSLYYYNKNNTSACSKQHGFESWKELVERLSEVVSQCSVWNQRYALERQKLIFFISLDALRLLYKEKYEKNTRILFLRKIQKIGKSNSLVTVKSMNTLFNKIIAFMLLYFSIALVDKILYLGNKVLNMKS